MQIQTHLLSGWCVGNLFPTTPRQRLACMLAATLADLDGFGFFINEETYWNYHHLLCHNLSFGLLLSAILTFATAGRFAVFLLYLALFHLHLLMDYFGSGPDWPIYYLWPFSHIKILNPHAWPLYSWQNLLTFTLFLAWTVQIAISRRRTPLEAIMPSLDQKITTKLRSLLS